MLYQPSGFGLLFLFGLDLAALALLYFLIRSPLRWERVLLYGSAVLLVFVSSFFKMLLSSSASMVSSPTDLRVENRLENSFQTFYYLSEDAKGQPHVVWKEFMLGRHEIRTLEGEGWHGLLIAKKMQGQWQSQRIQPGSGVVILDEAHFRPDTSGRVARAVWTNMGVELGTYLSELLTLAVLYLLVYRLAAFREQPGTPYPDVVSDEYSPV